jgi:DNA replication initiation complex subunit (GINS family)
MVDTPFRDISKKITINELTPKEKENYNKIKATVDKRLKEVSNNLNEEALEEGFINDFSKIPSEDLLTKCIIDGEP